jgi:geranylgeranyl diphosphate synthase, type II
MYSYSHCFEIVEQKISELKFHKEPNELFAPIRYTLEMGGKRIRPCLALMAHSIFNDNLEEVIDPALGLELFHNFTLLHDDIMDNSLIRRNHQTVHMKWNNNIAILSGDAMMILAYHYITKTSFVHLSQIMSLFNRTALEVCEGQQLDMNYENILSITEEQYLEMIRLKTAVLLAASLALGGITGNASEQDIDKLYQCGLNIGMAFQLQDDYLDVFARNDAFGKNIGSDIQANKKTYLLISALNSGKTEVVNSLINWIQGGNSNSSGKIEAVTSIYKQLRIDMKSIAIAEQYFNNGLAALDQLKADPINKSELRKLITDLKEREY